LEQHDAESDGADDGGSKHEGLAVVESPTREIACPNRGENCGDKTATAEGIVKKEDGSRGSDNDEG